MSTRLRRLMGAAAVALLLSSGCVGPPIAVSVRTHPETEDTKTCPWWFFPLMPYLLYDAYKAYSQCLDEAHAAGYE